MIPRCPRRRSGRIIPDLAAMTAKFLRLAVAHCDRVFLRAGSRARRRDAVPRQARRARARARGARRLSGTSGYKEHSGRTQARRHRRGLLPRRAAVIPLGDVERAHRVRSDRRAAPSIEKEVTGLGQLLRAPSAGGDFKAAASRLGGMLFDGISTADDRPMVIVPHGALQDVPFEVLTLQNRMVIERHAVSYAPSLNALVQLRRSPANTAPFRVLVVEFERAAAPPSSCSGSTAS